MNDTQVDSTPVHYQDGGIDKAVSQREAIELVEKISARDPERALHFLHKLWATNPEAKQLHWQFYATLSNLYLFDQLLDVCDERLIKTPNDDAALVWKVEALSKMSRHSQSIELLEKMVAGNKSDYQTLTKLGAYHKQLGQFDKAVWCFNRAIEQNHYYTAPYWLRSDICDAPEENLAALQALIASQNSPQDQQNFLHFAAYQYAERLEMFEEAFQHLQLANAYTLRSQSCHIADELAADQEIIDLFTKDFLAKHTNESSTEAQPIFIVGSPRCGSSLVEQIIASHSDVSRGGPAGALSNAILKAKTMARSNEDDATWMRTRHQTDWAWIGQSYQANTRFSLNGKRIITDKTLSNRRLLGVARLAFPNAKIISIERQPMDLCFGIYRQLFEPNENRYAYQLNDIVLATRSHQKLMKHWQSVFGDEVLQLTYEDLVKEPKTTISSVLEFCELSDEPACHRANETPAWVNTLSSKQVREPINGDGIERWRPYEDQLQDFLEL